MSLIEYKISQEQIDKGIAQLNAANPAYNYKTDSLLGKAANTNVVLGFIMGLIDLCTVGILEGIRYAYVTYGQSTYDKLCADFANRQLEIKDRKDSKTTDASIFRKSVRELEKQNREVFLDLRGRITKASDAPKANAENIRLAAQYKIEQAICQANGLKSDDDFFDEAIVEMATKASADLVKSVEDSGMRTGVSGLISSGLSSVDSEAIEELAADTGKDPAEVEREVGKQLRGRFANTTQGNREFAKATKAPNTTAVNAQVNKKIKEATDKLKAEVAARQKCVGELHRIGTELDKLKETLEDTIADLGTEAGEGRSLEEGSGVATGLYLDRDKAQKLLDKESVKGKARINAQNAFDEADEQIKKLEKVKEETENAALKLVAAQKKQEATLAKVEKKYGKLIADHFGIDDIDDGARSDRLKDDKVIKAIAIAGTRDEDAETEEGKLKFHSLPADLSKHFDKKALKAEIVSKHKPIVKNIAKIREAEIKRHEAEKTRKKTKELSEDKRQELDYFAEQFGEKIAENNAKLIRALGRRPEDVEDEDDEEEEFDVENAGGKGKPREIELDDDIHANNDGHDHDGDDNVDNDNVDGNKPATSLKSRLDKFKKKANSGDNNVDNNS